MPQGEDNNGQYHTSERWTDRAVSWGHLVIAMGGTALAVGGIIVTNEQRITRVEVRLQQALDDNRMQDERYYRTVSARNQEYAQLRNDINSRFDRIESEMTVLKIAVSTFKKQ